MMLAYLTMALATVAAVAIWVESSTLDRSRKEGFVFLCLDTAAAVEFSISQRYCACIWDEMRNHYSSGEIAEGFNLGVKDRHFDRRFMDAADDCQ